MKAVRRRRLFVGVLALWAEALVALSAGADEEVAVPLPLQMELLLKVAGYDKNLAARAPKLLVLYKPSSSSGSHVAQLASSLLAGKSLEGRALEVSSEHFVDAATLAQHIKSQRLAIIYLAPGFEPRELLAIAQALTGLSVLTAGALSRFVQTGVALGFDLVGGKPKLLIHQKRAKEQGVEFSSQVLKLAKVIE